MFQTALRSALNTSNTINTITNITTLTILTTKHLLSKTRSGRLRFVEFNSNTYFFYQHSTNSILGLSIFIILGVLTILAAFLIFSCLFSVHFSSRVYLFLSGVVAALLSVFTGGIVVFSLFRFFLLFFLFGLFFLFFFNIFSR